MEEKKYGDKYKWVWVYLIAAFVIFSVLLLILVMLESNRLRKFKVDAFVLCNESDICIANGPEGTIKVNSDNFSAIYSLIEKTHGSITLGKPLASESMSFDFTCHDSNWNLTVDYISEKKLRLILTGDRNYVVYIKNNGVYESFIKAASVQSFNAPNKKIG